MTESKCLERIAVVLPSLDPDAKFGKVVQGLVEAGFANIVIVDDGSCEERQKWFDEAAGYPQCTVIHHEVNKGKGRALKTAFSYIMENLPQMEGAVTIDGDGQHLTKDIIACGDALLDNKDKVIMGCRDFDAPGVPPRSVAGNKTTSRMFRLLFGIRISDTQTGLRAIPAEFLPQFCEMEGERFEYETNMLLQMKKMGIGFVEQPIETVYDPDDYSSHYNAVKDSWKIFKVMLRFIFSDSSAIRYVISSVSSFVLDVALFRLFLYFFHSPGVMGENLPTGVITAASHIAARIPSSLFNFNMNKFFVFRSRDRYWKDLLEYYCVCLPQMIVSMFLLRDLVAKMSISNPSIATFVKIGVDTLLFCISYFIQKKWVFKETDK
ncbi:MAG: bifunctional glycosyltransferase family 2/GtrA family protein [Oscillospiraceae bacterium]|nr:bifunctional glycosyltransferase family 2/GtrA family protein [Oscillospiraceae bacterium]